MGHTHQQEKTVSYGCGTEEGGLSECADTSWESCGVTSAQIERLTLPAGSDASNKNRVAPWTRCARLQLSPGRECLDSAAAGFKSYFEMHMHESGGAAPAQLSHQSQSVGGFLLIACCG